MGDCRAALAMTAGFMGRAVAYVLTFLPSYLSHFRLQISSLMLCITTQIYLHCLNRPGETVVSPLDRL